MLTAMILALANLSSQDGKTLTALDDRLILWQSLREGMSVEEAANALSGITGIRSAIVKGAKLKRVSISYNNDGIVIAGLKQNVLLAFHNNLLESVKLESEACLSLALEKYKAIDSILIEKYGPSNKKKEVSEDGSLVGARSTFSTTLTRVLLRLEPGSIPEHVSSSGKVGGLLAMMMNDAADEAISACPKDYGQKASIQMIYLNNANAAAADRAEQDDKDKQRENDKDKL